MHGLIICAIQSFFVNTYGPERWRKVTLSADLGVTQFEAMLIYDKVQSLRLLAAICAELGRGQSDVLEDLGTYLVSHPRVEGLRRLLRFGGVGYVDFLHSLDDLPDRARLAVSDLHLPGLELREHTPGAFSLKCDAGLPGYGSVMMGVLRAMADDYGALVLLDRLAVRDGQEVISITLVEAAFAAGRSFDLGVSAG